jgi:hypothetical protein
VLGVGAIFDLGVEPLGDSQAERLHEIGLYHVAESSSLLDIRVVSTNRKRTGRVL